MILPLYPQNHSLPLLLKDKINIIDLIIELSLLTASKLNYGNFTLQELSKSQGENASVAISFSHQGIAPQNPKDEL